MDLQIGTTLSGFTVTRIREIPGEAAQLLEMVYEKTGTGLVWVKSSEQNKLFSIVFKTLPEDDTGVYHILEHSVFCGSERYPLKAPLAELKKRSMYTFLDAGTCPDETIFPVSSRNGQDYLNLTAVILDAVFAPKVLTDPRIFYQEGCHCEPGGGTLRCNGVVLNERKGALSSADRVISEAVRGLLFPENCYGRCFGGTPEAIPALTYAQALAAYRKSYHPSNARIYLDGELPLEKTLALLDGYLSRFGRGPVPALKRQQPRAAERTVFYPATPGEGSAAGAQLVLAKITGSWADKTEVLAGQVLCDVLAGADDAPLRRAVLAAGLGREVTMQLSDGAFQPWLTLRIHNIQDEDAGRLRALVRDTARALAEQGLSRQALAASIHRLEFERRDRREPRGLARCQDAMSAWLYGGDPMLYLSDGADFAALREMARTGGFERLLERLLLDESGLCVLHALPSAACGQEARAREEARLAAARSAMTSEQLRALATQSEALRAWQQAPDTPEALAALPVLSRRELGAAPRCLSTCEERAGGVTVLRHKAETNGILHLSLYFSLTDLSLRELTAAAFAATLLGRLPTRRSGAAALQNRIKASIGRLEFGVEAFARAGETEACIPCLCARCSVLEENLPAAELLLAEILTQTDFRQPERIRELLWQNEHEARQRAVTQGSRLAAVCAGAHFSARNAVREAVSGYTRVRWLGDFAREFDRQIDGFTALAERILTQSVCTARLTASITGAGETGLRGLLEQLRPGTAAAPEAAYRTALPRKLGIRVPALVSHTGMAYHLAQCGERYHGTLGLLGNLLSLGDLWDAVRVRGGAYGAEMQAERDGSLLCTSYRDPGPARTLGVYRGMADWIETFCGSGEALDPFLAGAVARTEPLISPREQGARADALWFAGLGREALLRARRELLGAAPEDLLRWRGLLRAMARDAAVCVVGPGEALDACRAEQLTVVAL